MVGRMAKAQERPGRRAEYAATTRQAVVDAARRLFAEQGFFATKVDDIAAEARVAPVTVYQACGGKQGLLHTLMEAWNAAPVIETTYRQIADMQDGGEILRVTASGTRAVREEWGDIMRVILATAPHDLAAAQTLAVATGRYRAGFQRTADRLAEIGALREGVEVGTAVDVLWFYFGYHSYFTLVDDNKWSLTTAEDWLLGQARAALL
jgi:AcrR family transcriptional regulator